MFKFRYSQVLISTVTICLTHPVLYGQISVPDVTHTGIGKSVIPISAAEAQGHIGARADQLYFALSFRDSKYPKDSILAGIATTAAQWMKQVEAHPVQGLHLDPAGNVSVSAGEIEHAKQQIAERLRTPGLSLADKAYTYVTAVRTFSNYDYPERLPIAESYVTALQALGDSAAAWEWEARYALFQTYYMLGRTSDVIRHGMRAVALVGIMPFVDRQMMFPELYDPVYSQLVEALTGLPDAKPKIAWVNATLEAAVIPPPDVAAFDTAFIRFGKEEYEPKLRKIIQANLLLGTEGKPLIANYWLNRPTRDSATIPVNDGKVKLVEVAGYGCPTCLEAMHGLQRIGHAAPRVEVLMVTFLYGAWANRNVTPQAEAEKMAEHFLNYMKITFPIGIWKAKVVPNEDGGTNLDGVGPTAKAYPLLSKPVIWALDGQGRIRRIFQGFDRDKEQQMLQTVQFLQREAREHADPQTAAQ